MSYICIACNVGHSEGKTIWGPGHILYEWKKRFDPDLKPDSYERAKIILDAYEANDIVENKFTVDQNHPRYGLSDDYFWLNKGELWAMVRNPVTPGDFVFVEKKMKTVG
tara:strand:- start:1257 stop:1583 length:327 start_codon:yes stop_codon:yes gene_type:complete